MKGALTCCFHWIVDPFGIGAELEENSNACPRFVQAWYLPDRYDNGSFKHSFLYTTARLWTDIPDSLFLLPTIKSQDDPFLPSKAL